MKKENRDILLLGLVCLWSMAAYLYASSQMAGVGFPLDDAWIHQTFARNFAREGNWAFQAGNPSGGSTGPGYGMIIALIHKLGLPVVWGTHWIGFLTLWGLAIGVYLLVRELLGEGTIFPLISGILICLEWHLVWSALSGMETLSLPLIAVYLLLWMLKNEDHFWVTGILVGISIWIRPDGITLSGPVLLTIVLSPGIWKRKIVKLAQFGGALLVIALPYFIFNQLVAGDIWPNTFFAKQAEYAILRQTSYYARYGKMSLQIITGVGAVLLPGLIFQIGTAFEHRNWIEIGFFAWLFGYLGIYAWRLPVIYQHGRYVMPVIPVMIVFGAVGLFKLIRPAAEQVWIRILSRTTLIAGGIVLIIFWGLGARAYALDVGVIETAMVGTAKWINQNTELDAVIGAHDIGALGYFSERQILDLAGLVSPDVIPFIRDENRLATYLDLKEAEYLVTFPGWYPALVNDLQVVYESDSKYTDMFEADRMTVYIWD